MEQRDGNRDSHIIKISPHVRFRLYIADEMAAPGGANVFTPERHQKFIEKFQEIEKKRDAILRSWILSSSGMAAILFGANINIPGFDISIREIPAALEILTAASALALVFLIFQMNNWRCYHSIISIYNEVSLQGSNFDPEIITASNIVSELYLKLIRYKFYIHKNDTLKPPRSFKIFQYIIEYLLILSVISFFILYQLLVFYSLYTTLLSTDSIVISVAYVFFIFIIMLGCLAVAVFNRINFTFRIQPVRMVEPID